MHELVHSTLHSKLLSSVRRPSFAGNGLPERMRSVSFALLGLTAAAGLALVAIFAQPSFPLLSPAPLPDEPSAHESIAEAKTLPADHGSASLFTALPAPADPKGPGPTAGDPRGGTSGSSGSGGKSDGVQVAPAEVDVPAPVTAPQPASENSGGSEAGYGTGGGSDPVPVAAPVKPTAAPSTPVSSPKPPKSKPEAITSAPKPEPAPAPGNSSSAAAAEHASERGIEASAGAGPPASAPAPAPESAAAPGNGKGLAKGHYK
jgi:hypothetical protein